MLPLLASIRQSGRYWRPNQRVNVGDRITVTLPAPEDPTPQGEDIPLDVVFEDDDLIVINKPAGLVVHPAAGQLDRNAGQRPYPSLRR